jgi:circadian clock protein KaiC
MAKSRSKPAATIDGIAKSPSGIQGLDDITGGGLPTGRPTLVCGSAGCGKTLLAMEFLVRGATQFDEPGVFVSFEESKSELTTNVASLGFDLDDLARRKRLVVDHVYLERSEIHETGEYDLEGLFVRLAYSIDSIGAKRVAIDTLEALFASLPNEAVLRAELRRLFRWLKEKGVTAVITAERGSNSLTRHGIEEYVSDCVILLDHRVNERVATRHLRIVKYRGAMHGTNEYPFLIGDEGISVLPITSLGLGHTASKERISTGIPRLDAMLGGKGFYRGSSILLTGSAGTGKTSVAAHFAQAAAQRGERALYFAFEESPSQIARDMRSIGLHLDDWIERDVLRFHSARPTLYGLEMHLATMFKEILRYRPSVVVVDPITSLLVSGSPSETKAMVTRLIDYLKTENVTALFTSLVGTGERLSQSEIAISSLMDSWILLQDVEGNGERNRILYVLKSRGMAHSNQVREFLITDSGIDLVDAYVGTGGVLTGTARVARVAREQATAQELRDEAVSRENALQRKRTALDRQVAALLSEAEADEEDFRRLDGQRLERIRSIGYERTEMARLRHADDVGPATGNAPPSRKKRGKGRRSKK